MAKTRLSEKATYVTRGYGQVEPNHLSAQKTGQIYAQLPAAADIDILENGQFATYNYAADDGGAVDFDGAGEWMMVFNEVKVYRDFESDCDFAMKKEDYIKRAKKKFRGKARKIVLEQIDNYYSTLNLKISYTTYKEGDIVYLKKGTLLHGTYRNIEGLIDIVNNGLIASIFTNGRLSKYPSCVSVWNLKNDYKLKDYINYYSGGTIKYNGLIINNEYSQECSTEIIPYDEMCNINKYILNNKCRMWTMEQTKEARFLPSLIQDIVEIGIIFNGY